MSLDISSLDRYNLSHSGSTFAYPALPLKVEYAIAVAPLHYEDRFRYSKILEVSVTEVSDLSTIPVNGVVGHPFWPVLVFCRLAFSEPVDAIPVLGERLTRFNTPEGTRAVVDVCNVFFDETKTAQTFRRDGTDIVARFFGINLMSDLGASNHWGYSFFSSNKEDRNFPLFCSR